MDSGNVQCPNFGEENPRKTGENKEKAWTFQWTAQCPMSKTSPPPPRIRKPPKNVAYWIRFWASLLMFGSVLLIRYYFS